MSQTLYSADTTQFQTAVFTSNYPKINSNDVLLLQLLKAIAAMHAAEPVATIAYDESTLSLAVTLEDNRSATYTFEDLTPYSNRFTIDFGESPSGWLESLIDLLDLVKEAVLFLNEKAELTTYDWESV